MARYHGPADSGALPSGIYSAQVAFDASGHLTGLVQSSTKPLVPDAEIHFDMGARSHDWSPDGTRLVYAAGPRQSAGLYILDLTTHQTRKLTRGIAPAWSPDGSLIAFRRSHDAVLTIHADGSGLRTLVQWPAHPGMTYTIPRPGYYQVVWSPDSTALLYGVLELTGDAREIYRIASAGGEPQSITRGVLQSAVPVAWLKGEN